MLLTHNYRKSLWIIHNKTLPGCPSTLDVCPVGLVQTVSVCITAFCQRNHIKIQRRINKNEFSQQKKNKNFARINVNATSK